jgi:hypothetical protein
MVLFTGRRLRLGRYTLGPTVGSGRSFAGVVWQRCKAHLVRYVVLKTLLNSQDPLYTTKIRRAFKTLFQAALRGCRVHSAQVKLMVGTR